MFKKILVTGGSGFIGSNFIRFVFKETDFSGELINLDKLTYSGNPQNLSDVQQEYGGKRYFFEHADICDGHAVTGIFEKYGFDCIVHFAAESHVDRSIFGPQEFIQTNILGTFVLLEAARKGLNHGRACRFHHISSDEVYGSLGPEGLFSETTPFDPRSPYSASKASSDHLVKAYFHTYGLPVTISNCSNNYGPFQFPEKLIPLAILNLIEKKPLPVYGDGKNIRDWIYVQDHCRGVWSVLEKGKSGETYNIGGETEVQNIDLVNLLCEVFSEKTGRPASESKNLITYVKDRPGHDRRYAINCEKIKVQLGWKTKISISEGLGITVDWYLTNGNWIENVKSGGYKTWVDKNYTNR